MKKFTDDRRGGVAILVAAMASLLLIAAGVGIDYGRSKSSETRLDAAADSAALLAVSRSMMNSGLDHDTIAQKAKDIFTQETAEFRNNNGISDLIVNVSFASSDSSKWDFTLSYTARSQNYFSQILGVQTLPISGVSQTHNETAPDMNFWFLFDTSMSMALPTTTAGMNQLLARENVPAQKFKTNRTCVFACHFQSRSNSSNSPLGLDAQNHPTDLYSVLRSYETPIDATHWQRPLKFPLRIDAEIDALRAIRSTVTAISAKNRAKYQFAVYQFNAAETWDEASVAALTTAWQSQKNSYNSDQMEAWLANITNGKKGEALVHALDGDLDQAVTDAEDRIQVPIYYKDNEPVYYVTGNPFIDYDTASDNAFDKMNSIITGYAQSDAKKALNVMLVVTDGFRDDRGSRGGGYSLKTIVFSQDKCQAIKDNGTKIAILYTKYDVGTLQGDGWSSGQGLNESKLNTISDALQSCATPGLFSTVTVDQDISKSFASLFSNVIATARITH